MTRIIKFRVYNPKFKMISECFSLSDLYLGKTKGADFTGSIWMQFTGLLDKNGKEIYEGDIFQCRSGNDKCDMLGEIYFDKGMFRMQYGFKNPKKGDRKDYFLSGSINTDIEIIGNIYENPELTPNQSQ